MDRTYISDWICNFCMYYYLFPDNYTAYPFASHYTYHTGIQESKLTDKY